MSPKISNPVKVLDEPAFIKALFGDTRWAWLWLCVRLYVGWQWLAAGWGKVNNPAWTGPQAGVALTGFISNALTKATGEHPDVQGWYAWFLQQTVKPYASIWSYGVAWGELLVGLGLILGTLTGLAAFFGSFMNFNYLMAGTVSINPPLLVLGIGLVLAWKTAGWWGGDRWFLPALGRLLRRPPPAAEPQAPDGEVPTGSPGRP